MVQFAIDRKSLWGKEKNAAHLYFLPFPQCFQKGFSLRMLKHRIVWERVKKMGLLTDLSKISGKCFFMKPGPDTCLIYYKNKRY